MKAVAFGYEIFFLESRGNVWVRGYFFETLGPRIQTPLGDQRARVRNLSEGEGETPLKKLPRVAIKKERHI